MLRDQRAAQELPKDFDPAVMLPGADASLKASIMDTFPLVFCLRWLTLRNEVAHPPAFSCMQLNSTVLCWAHRKLSSLFSHSLLCMCHDLGCKQAGLCHLCSCRRMSGRRMRRGSTSGAQMLPMQTRSWTSWYTQQPTPAACLAA